MSDSIIQYLGKNDNRLSSPSIWHDCPFSQISRGSIDGYHMFDDFTMGGITTTITSAIAAPEIGNGGYNAFGSSGATITYDNVVGGGVIFTEATADESVSINTEQHPFSITQNAGKFWFEARIKTSTITASEQNWFVGLMDAATLIVGLPLAVGGVPISTQNFVGFLRPELNTTTFDAIYSANSVSLVEVNSSIGSVTVDTYFKIGMKFDPTYGETGTANQLSYFIDGTRQTTSKTIPDNTGTDFPADVRMGPCFGMILGNSAEETITMDWWRFAQLATNS